MKLYGDSRIQQTVLLSQIWAVVKIFAFKTTVCTSARGSHVPQKVPGCVPHDARLCAGWLGSVEGHPWIWREKFWLLFSPMLKHNSFVSCNINNIKEINDIVKASYVKIMPLTRSLECEWINKSPLPANVSDTMNAPLPLPYTQDINDTTPYKWTQTPFWLKEPQIPIFFFNYVLQLIFSIFRNNSYTSPFNSSMEGTL